LTSDNRGTNAMNRKRAENSNLEHTALRFVRTHYDTITLIDVAYCGLIRSNEFSIFHVYFLSV